MKARSFLIALGLAIIILLGIAIGLLQHSNSSNTLKIKTQNLDLPEAALFFPKDSSLTLHIDIDTKRFPNYLEAAAPQKQRKKALKRGIEVREALFSLAGLNYMNDLRSWISPKISLCILESNALDNKYEWILAVQNIDSQSKNSFIENFWGTKILDNSEPEKEIYKNIEIISGNFQSSRQKEQAISTSFINENLVLVTSNKETMEKAIDVSENGQSQMNKNTFIDEIEQLEDGFALISISPEALTSWFEIPKNLTERKGFEGFIGSIKNEYKDLYIDGYFKFNEQVGNLLDQTEEGLILLDDFQNNSADLAIISEPSSLLYKNSKNVITELTKNIFSESLKSIDSPAASIIAEVEQGPLVWIHDEDGWLLGTKGNAQLPIIRDLLNKEGFIKTIISTEEDILEAWSKLVLGKDKNHEFIETKLAIILSHESNQNWWSNSVESLRNRKNMKSLQPINSFSKVTNKNNNQSFPFQIHLASKSAENKISNWKPWLLLKTALGRSFQPNIKGITIALGTDKDSINSFINFRGQLSFL